MSVERDSMVSSLKNIVIPILRLWNKVIKKISLSADGGTIQNSYIPQRSNNCIFFKRIIGNLC